MSKITEAGTAIASSAKAAGFDPSGDSFRVGTSTEVANIWGSKTVGNGTASFSVRMYLSTAGAIRFAGHGLNANGDSTNFNSRAAIMEWFVARAEDSNNTWKTQD